MDNPIIYTIIVLIIAYFSSIYGAVVFRSLTFDLYLPTYWSRLLLLNDVFSEHVPFRRCRGDGRRRSAQRVFFVPSDLDL